MKANTPWIVLGIIYCQNVFAQYHQTPIFPEDSSFLLIQKLVDTYKPFSVLDYQQARLKMYTEIYNSNDSVSCVYTGHTLYLDPTSPDPIGLLFQNGSPNGINCEHSYPQSKGADTGNARSDMHHLFPARAAVNEARSNFPFSEIADTKVNNWYYKSISKSSIPEQSIDEYSESTYGLFEPREDFKGNIARAIFYFYTMYELQADRNFFERMKTTLCDWHQLDPVDSSEWTRTFQIAKYQDSKPNPFILDCSLLKRSYCPLLPLCQSNTSTIKVDRIDYFLKENPAGNTLKFELKNSNEPFQLILSQISGKQIRSFNCISEKQELNIEFLPAGVYLIQLHSAHKNPGTGLFIKR